MPRLAAVLLTAFAVAAAGCGGDDDSDERAMSSGSQAQPDSVGMSGDHAETSTTADEDKANGDGGSGGGDAIPKSEYIAKADPICRDAREEIGRNGQEIAEAVHDAQQSKISPAEYFKEAARLTGESAKAAEVAIAKLEDITPPASGQDALQRYLAGTHLQADNLAKQADALAKRDQAEVARLNRKSVQTSAGVAKASHEFGFHVCGNPRA
jgi:hypothetical protein